MVGIIYPPPSLLVRLGLTDQPKYGEGRFLPLLPQYLRPWILRGVERQSFGLKRYICLPKVMAHGISQEKLDEIGLEPEQVNGKEFLAPVYRIT